MKTPRSNPLLTLCTALVLTGGLSSTAVTFNEALDTTGLAWTTGGDAAWIATNAAATPAFDGVDAAVNGTITHNQETWVQTTVTGPGNLSFWWSVSSDDGEGVAVGDWLEFYVDGELQEAIAGDVFPIWQYANYALTNGSHTLRWRYVKDDDINFAPDQGYLDQVKFVPAGTQPSLAEALNTPYTVWLSGGNFNPTYWEGQTNVSHVDGMAGESGAITHLQTNWMETTVVGVTNVSFWWKVSSESGFDLLRFSTNGVVLFTISGEVDWQLKTNIALPPGINTLRWSFSKDDTDYFPIGQNRGWVDEVTFSPAFVPSTNIMLSIPVLTNGQAHFTVTNKIGLPCSVYYSTNLATGKWTLLVATNSLSSATVNVSDPGATQSPARFYRASSP